MKNLIILCSIATIILSGCYQNQTSVETIKLSGWGSESEISILKPLLKEFERQNPDIKVEFIHIPQNYFQKLHLLVASNLVPDVVFINNINLPLYAENSVFKDLTPYMSDNPSNSLIKKGFFPRSLDAFKYKGKLYAIPRDVSNLVVYYNKDIFDREKTSHPNPKWNFYDYLNTCKKLTADYNNDGRIDVFGSSFEEAPLFWLPWLWSNGGGLISKDLKSLTIDNEQSIEALQFYADLRNKYHVAPTKSEAGSSTMAQLFIEGKIAMFISGRWNTPRFRKDIKFNWDIARFPRGKAGSIVDCDSSGWAISNSTKHTEKAIRLVKFLSGSGCAEKFAKSGLIIPARIEAANRELMQNTALQPESSGIFIEIIPDSIPTPATANYQEISDIVNNRLELLWNGKETANQLIDSDFTNKLNNYLRPIRNQKSFS